MRPMRVVRSSLVVAQTGPSFSASMRIERNFMIVKGRPLRPTRSCL